ncbi:MAG: metallophosphoesterase [Candidatus Muiribacteriota bacterium]
MKDKFCFNLFFTNDLHGNFLGLNALLNLKRNSRVPSISIDTGDTFGLDYSGEIIYKILPYAADFWLPGNHDLLHKNSKIKNYLFSPANQTVATNVKFNNENLKHNFFKSKIILINKVRIGILGLTSPVKAGNVVFKDSGRALIESIKTIQGCDVLILLSHLGIKEDKRIAEACPEIDVIIGGHTHTKMNFPEIFNKTIIFQTSGYGMAVAQLKLEIKRRKISGFSSGLYNPFEFPLESDFKEMIYKIKKKYNIIFNLKNNIFYSKYSENPISEMILKALAKNTGVDNVILNSSLINPFLIKGPVTEEDIKRILGYKLNLFILNMPGKQLIKIIKRSRKDTYTKIHSFLKLNAIKENQTYQTLVTDFLSNGGHHGGSMFPEFVNKNKKRAEINLKKVISNYLVSNKL